MVTINTNTAKIKKAVDQFGQDKVNRVLNNKINQGSTVTNTSTNAVVPGVVQPTQPVTPTPITDSAPDTLMYGTKMDTSTGAPELVQKTFISPTLQAKIDAKNAPKPVETPPTDLFSDKANLEMDRKMNEKGELENKKKELWNTYAQKQGIDPETGEPVKTEAVDTVKTETTPTGAVEVSDVEKQAQATGIPYTMENGQPVYNTTNKDEAVKVLQMGGKLAGETKMNAVAQATLNKVRGYAQMTDQQLANDISLGKVSSKELELLNQVNPNLVAKAQEFSKKKTITNTSNEVQSVNNSIINGGQYDGVSAPLKELLNKLATIDADQRSPAEMKAQFEANNPEMIQSREAINTLQTQKREIEKAKRDLWDDYKAKNSDMPISMILAGYNIASKGLDDQMYTINDNLNTEISNYNSYLDEMNAEMDWELKQQGKEEERLWNIYGVTSKEQIRQEDIQREDARIEQSIQLEEARYQRDIERDDKISAQNRLDKLEDLKLQQNFNIETGLLKMGVNPAGMTPEEMKATYARAIGKQILESKVIPTKWERTTTIDAEGNEVEVFFDPNTGETRSPSELRGVIFGDTPGNSDVGALALLPGQDLLAVPNETIVETRLTEVSPQNAKIRGKECAEYVNDVFQQSLFGNTIADKLRVAKDKNGTIGSAAVWTPSGSGEYGHVGIIVDEDENNWYIKSSNLKAGTVTTDKVPKSSIKGYYTTPEVKAYQPQDNGNKNLGGIAEYLIDTQARGAGYSDADSEAFSTAVKKYAERGDSDIVYQLARERVMNNKNVGPKIYDNMELKSGLDAIRGMLEEYGQTGDTGVLTNMAEVSANFFGRTTDEQLAKANNKLGLLVADYIRAISGTAASDREVARLINNLPKIKNIKSFNYALLDSLNEEANRKMKTSIETALGFKKDIAKEIFPEIYTSGLPEDDELEALSIR